VNTPTPTLDPRAAYYSYPGTPVNQTGYSYPPGCSNIGCTDPKSCINSPNSDQCKADRAIQDQATKASIYNTLNTVTFGTFGNYVNTYAGLNSQNNPDDIYSYLQNAYAGRQSAAQLGIVLTAEGALIYTGAAAGGGILTTNAAAGGSLSTLPLAAYSYITAALAGSTALNTGLAALNVAGNGYYGYMCFTNPNSAECQTYTAAISGNPQAVGESIGSSLNTINNTVQNFLDNAVNKITQSINTTGLFADTQSQPPSFYQGGIPKTVTLDTGEVVTIQGQLGLDGSQGIVYQGTTCSGSTCAVKLFTNNPNSQWSADTALQNQLWLNNANTNQLNVMQNTQSAVLPEYYGAVIQNGKVVGYSMELIQGDPLRAITKANDGIIPNDISRNIFNAAIQYQVDTGLPHGDLAKPYSTAINQGNIFITGNPSRPVVFIDPIGGTILNSYLPANTVNPLEALKQMEIDALYNNLLTPLN
jgi:hypothetical protein